MAEELSIESLREAIRGTGSHRAVGLPSRHQSGGSPLEPFDAQAPLMMLHTVFAAS